MQTIKCDFKRDQSYSIYIGQNILGGLVEYLKSRDYSKLGFIVDSNTQSLITRIPELRSLSYSVFCLQSGEKNKSLKSIEEIWNFLHKNQFDRKSLLIALGGGVVGDITGFAASTYMRGLDFIALPTTVLSQVDSSVGGKTGFNFNQVKNLIGSFYQPQSVWIETEFLETLPKKALIQGYGEVLKYGLIWDRDFWQYLVELSCKDQFDPANIARKDLQKIIHRAIKIKAEIVEKDETESIGLRNLLNFGHTFGHAIESLSFEINSGLWHGEAVAIGMYFEAYLSYKFGRISLLELESIKKTIKAWRLPWSYEFEIKEKDKIIQKLMKLVLSDKKNSSGRVNWTLLQKIGRAESLVQVPEGFLKEQIKEVFFDNL